MSICNLKSIIDSIRNTGNLKGFEHFDFGEASKLKRDFIDIICKLDKDTIAFLFDFDPELNNLYKKFIVLAADIYNACGSEIAYNCTINCWPSELAIALNCSVNEALGILVTALYDPKGWFEMNPYQSISAINDYPVMLTYTLMNYLNSSIGKEQIKKWRDD